jgi:hypothetical protein
VDPLHGTLVAGMLRVEGAALETLSAQVYATDSSRWMTRSSWLVRGYGWAAAEGARLTVDAASHALTSQAVVESMQGGLHICTDGAVPGLPGVVPCGSLHDSLRIPTGVVTTSDLTGPAGRSPTDRATVQSVPAADAAVYGARALFDHPEADPARVAEAFFLATRREGEALVFEPERLGSVLGRERADLNGDGRIDAADLVELLSAAEHDLTGDGVENTEDVVRFLEELTSGKWSPN